jgi:hypothetical protein
MYGYDEVRHSKRVSKLRYSWKGYNRMVISLLLLIWSAANKRLGVGTFSTPAARASVEWMAVLLHRDLLVMSPFVPSLLTRYSNTLF